MGTKRLRAILIVTILLHFFTANYLFSQKTVIKSNIPYWATATPNAALELGLSKKLTLDIAYGVNPFTFKEGRTWKHWLAQTEVRYWPYKCFSEHFLGLHVGASEYSLNKIKIPTVTDARNFRYEGWAFMGGISYGYSWTLGEHWNVEATLGLGLMYIDYNKYECAECGRQLEEDNKLFFAPTRAAINIVYILK